MFKVKIISFSNFTELDPNSSQNSILSPFLFNVYVTPFDCFVKELKIKFEKLSSTIIDDIKNVYYIRYADNLLLGLHMDKKFAKILRVKIKHFIKSNLQMEYRESSFNARLIHCRSEPITFLGFQIWCHSYKFNPKSTYLIRFHKLKVSIQRKKIAESEAYFKMVERVLAKHHRHLINSIRTQSQTLIKQSQIKKVNNSSVKVKLINDLKKSLSVIESEILVPSINPHKAKTKKSIMKYTSSMVIAEQKRLNLLNIITQK